MWLVFKWWWWWWWPTQPLLWLHMSHRGISAVSTSPVSVFGIWFWRVMTVDTAHLNTHQPRYHPRLSNLALWHHAITIINSQPRTTAQSKHYWNGVKFNFPYDTSSVISQMGWQLTTRHVRNQTNNGYIYTQTSYYSCRQHTASTGRVSGRVVGIWPHMNNTLISSQNAMVNVITIHRYSTECPNIMQTETFPVNTRNCQFWRQ